MQMLERLNIFAKIIKYFGPFLTFFDLFKLIFPFLPFSLKLSCMPLFFRICHVEVIKLFMKKKQAGGWGLGR